MTESIDPPGDDAEFLVAIEVESSKSGYGEQIWLIKGNGPQSKPISLVSLEVPIHSTDLENDGGRIIKLAMDQKTKRTKAPWKRRSTKPSVFPVTDLTGLTTDLSPQEMGRGGAYSDGRSSDEGEASEHVGGADQRHPQPVHTTEVMGRLDSVMAEITDARRDLSNHINETERRLEGLRRVTDNLRQSVSWVERRPFQDVEDVKQSLESQVSVINAELSRLVDQVTSLPSRTDAELRAHQGVVLSKLDDARDEIIAATTRSFRTVLPDLNRRFRDAQAVVVRLDRQLRSILTDFEVSDELRVAIVGQLDDHLNDAQVHVPVVDGERLYVDIITGEEL